MTKKAGVIGWPISHSKSPLIHNHWLGLCNIDGAYDAVPVAPDQLAQDIDRLVRAGYAGFNVTVPHKQAVMQHLDFIRADAERIGAVNTVIVGPDGSLEGRNTDAYGFIENIRQNAPEFKFKGPAVVLGAGGAARAVVYALLREGMDNIRIFNRTLPRANELAASFPPAIAKPWEAIPDLTRDAALIVNTTTLGMAGHPPLEIDFTRVNAAALVNDIVYTPLETQFLKDAKANGNKTVTGIGMLLHQARPAFQAWFGILPDVDAELAQKVLA